MLAHRLVTGPLLIVAMFGLFWADERATGRALPAWLADLLGRATVPPGSILWLFVVAVIVPLATREMAALLRAQGIAARWWLHLIAAAAGATLLWLPSSAFDRDPGTHSPLSIPIVGLVLASAAAAAFILHARDATIQGVAAASGGTLLALVVLGVMPGFYLALRDSQSAWVVLGALLTAKSCDIGAYFVGRAVGRHKLIPWLSPGKTWEGVFGGVVVGAGVGAGLALLGAALAPTDPISPWLGAVAGALFAIVGLGGDLGESLLKRAASAKDSGCSLPGMGGVLDVIDSAVAVAPVAWLLLR